MIEYTLATKASHSQYQNLARVWRWLLPPLIVVKLNVHAVSQISLLCLILKMLLLAQSEYLTSKTMVQWWLQEFCLGGSLKNFNKKNLNISNYRPKKKI